MVIPAFVYQIAGSVETSCPGLGRSRDLRGHGAGVGAEAGRDAGAVHGDPDRVLAGAERRGRRPRWRSGRPWEPGPWPGRPARVATGRAPAGALDIGSVIV